MKQASLTLMMLALASACSNSSETERAPQSTRSQQQTQKYEDLARVSFVWRSHGNDEVAHRACVAAEILGAPCDPASVMHSLEAEPKEGRKQFVRLGTFEGDNFVASYDRTTFDLRVSRHRTIVSDATTQDVGEDVARAVFHSVAQRLFEARILDQADYDLEHSKTSQTLTVSGDESGARHQAVEDYGFGALHHVDGLEIENAFLSVRVRADGVPSSIRLGGVHANGIVEYVRATRTPEEASAQFLADHPGAHVYSSRVGYAMPTTDIKLGESFEVEPRLVVHFADRRGESVSRQRVLALSLTDMSAQDLSPTPKPDGIGDSRR